MSQKNTLGLKLVAGIKDYTKIKVYCSALDSL